MLEMILSVMIQSPSGDVHEFMPAVWMVEPHRLELAVNECVEYRKVFTKSNLGEGFVVISADCYYQPVGE